MTERPAFLALVVYAFGAVASLWIAFMDLTAGPPEDSRKAVPVIRGGFLLWPARVAVLVRDRGRVHR